MAWYRAVWGGRDHGHILTPQRTAMTESAFVLMPMINPKAAFSVSSSERGLKILRGKWMRDGGRNKQAVRRAVAHASESLLWTSWSLCLPPLVAAVVSGSRNTAWGGHHGDGVGSSSRVMRSAMYWREGRRTLNHPSNVPASRIVMCQVSMISTR